MMPRMSVAMTLVLAALGLTVLAGGLLYGESIANLFASQVSGSGKADHYSAPGERTAHPGSGRTTTAVEGAPEDEVFFPRQRKSGLGPSALGHGKLVVDEEGCIRMKPLPQDPGFVPIWPPDYELDTEGDKIEILNGKGKVVAQVGKEVSMGGGQVDVQRSLVDARTARELRERCSGGGYWLVTEGFVRMPRQG
jgi:hypothetical protein